MSFVSNWKSGNMVIKITDKSDNAIRFMTATQQIDPVNDSNIDVIDTLHEHRVGYLQRPSTITITLSTIASNLNSNDLEPDIVANISDFLNDSSMLTYLHLKGQGDGGITGLEGFFDMEVTDANFTHDIKFINCIVATGNPSTVVIDNVPLSQWTLLALDVTKKEKLSSAVPQFDGSPSNPNVPYVVVP